jgi:hypothetical protein
MLDLRCRNSPAKNYRRSREDFIKLTLVHQLGGDARPQERVRQCISLSDKLEHGQTAWWN